MTFLPSFFRVSVAFAVTIFLSSCAFPWENSSLSNTGSTKENPLFDSGTISSESTPKTVEEFSARELSGALVSTVSPSENTGTATTESGTITTLTSTQTRLQRARELHRKNVFAAFVRRGDWYFLRNDKETALKSYLVALSRTNIPEDKKAEISLRIADTYFALKRFPEAVSFYKKAGNIPSNSALSFALALSYINDAEKISLLPSLALSDDQKKYFAISYTCREGVQQCVDSINNYTGTGDLVLNLKTSLADFDTIAAEDTAYRDALLASAFLKNRDFAAAATIADAVLKRRPDYLPVLKLAGRAWWEIGNYDNALSHLQRYYRANPKDVEVAFLVGMSYLGKEDFETASVFFNRAVLGGYTPRSDAERHLAYTYFMMGSPDNLWQVLGYMLREPDIVESDFSTAIWLAISAENTKDATLWITSGLAKFPKSAWLQAMQARLSRLMGDPIAQKNAIDAAVAIDPENPLTLLERGIWFASRFDSNYQADFARVIELDPEGVFGIQAQEQLAKIGSGTTLSGSNVQNSPSGTTLTPLP